MKQKSNIHSYADYIDACTKLGLDLSLPKTYIPHDLKYWHDYRIDEETAKDKLRRRSQGLCQHCGNKFKKKFLLFGEQICTKCGRKKDY